MDKSLYAATRQRLEPVQKLRKQLIRDIYYRVPLLGENVEEINDYYCFNMESGGYQLILLRILSRQGEHIPVPESVLRAVEDKMARDLRPMFRELETAVIEGRILCFVNIITPRLSQETDQFKLAIGRFFAEISTAKAFRDYSFLMSEGNTANAIGGLDDCMQSAIQAMEYGAVYGLNHRYDSYEQIQTLGDIIAILTPSRKLEFRHLVETVNTAEIETFIDGLFAESYHQVKSAPALAYQLPHKLLELATDAIGEYTGQERAVTAFCKLWHQKIDDCFCLETLKQLTIGGIQALCEQYGTQLLDGQSPAVMRSKAYIKSNYQKQLYLSDIAGYVHLNPQYLSMLFRQETGQSVSDYIGEIRMEHARLLLRNTTHSIQTIAEAVGYSDPQYFSRRFKQLVGQSPMAYRSKNVDSHK